MLDIPPLALCPHLLSISGGNGVTIDDEGVDETEEFLHLLRIEGHCAGIPSAAVVTLIMTTEQLTNLMQVGTDALRETP
jgi:hypothetical protein